jgi:hypothetical protein
MLRHHCIRVASLIAFCVAIPAVRAQQTEADTGFGLQGTFSALSAASTELTEAPRSGSIVDAGFRLMLYPTWKLSRHWMFYGAYQTVSRPYYYSAFATQGHGVRGSLTQGYLSYSQVWQDASLQVKAGELASAFGSFPLRYDDRDNALVDVPLQYGYYSGLATLNALAGVELDATWKKVDARAQFTNSSPANPRSITASEQYGCWAGGAGYTIVQGLREWGRRDTGDRIWTVNRRFTRLLRDGREVFREAAWEWMRSGVTVTGMCAANCSAS